ncbi:MAG: uroporphyrinogen-III C-methyltransferase [Candidatus Latescibacteria bacterium]|nr:uroporphyrinogen-III C-methyltransferase [Candidatus Latescibacterota bacterium]
MTQGRVVLVGAGPGDPELITVRGLRCLRTADVVVYDRLVSLELLDETPEGCKRIAVGKTPGRPSVGQDSINDLLVQHAQNGATVVRLKGGDPFVFGRGGEEIAACTKAGVACEVVPGISSALAVPSGVGIPLTHRGVSGAFAVVTAHRAVDHDAQRWDALAKIDTVVVLMGVGRLGSVAEKILSYGRNSDTPAAVIERGTLKEQRLVIGTLGDIADICTNEDIKPPAVVVIGEVVAVRGQLQLIAEEVDAHSSPHLAGVPEFGEPIALG